LKYAIFKLAVFVSGILLVSYRVFFNVWFSHVTSQRKAYFPRSAWLNMQLGNLLFSKVRVLRANNLLLLILQKNGMHKVQGDLIIRPNFS
jgi:hypothetical protein